MLIRGVFLLVGLLFCLAASGGLQQKANQACSGPTNLTCFWPTDVHRLLCRLSRPQRQGQRPAAEALKVPPPDLTALARKNGGKYPSDHVRSTIEGNLRLPRPGLNGMPAWGDLFWRMSQGHSSEVQLRVSNLNEHIESLQAK